MTLTGLVDADRYVDNFIHFPARWRDPDFNGILPAGTPVAQCLPLKRDRWTAQFGTITGEAATRLRETTDAIKSDYDVYRRRFRVAKH
jgi:hypothetical protein